MFTTLSTYFKSQNQNPSEKFISFVNTGIEFPIIPDVHFTFQKTYADYSKYVYNIIKYKIQNPSKNGCFLSPKLGFYVNHYYKCFCSPFRWGITKVQDTRNTSCENPFGEEENMNRQINEVDIFSYK